MFEFLGRHCLSHCIAQTGKIGKHRRHFCMFLDFFRSMEKMAWDGPKWGREDFFPANPDLANILGRTYLDFEIFFSFCWIPNFWISSFPDFQNLAWTGLGPWAGLGPCAGWAPRVGRVGPSGGPRVGL